MIQPSAKTLRIILAMTFASMMFVGAAKAPAYASSSNASLPVIRLDYNTGLTGWNNTLDPANTQYTNDADTEMLMNDGLVRILPPVKTNGAIKVVLGLADKVTVSKDRKTYTFHIRNNAKFANGHPVTAQDVIFSIQRAAAPSTDPQVASSYDSLIAGVDAFNKGQANKISGLKAINAKTIQVHITKPAAYFFTAFAYSSNYVLDRKLVGSHKVGDLTTTCALNKGAGPFVPVCQNSSSDVTSFYKGGSTPTLTLVPNKYYYGPKPKVKLVLPIYTDATVLYNQYRAGQADMAAPSPVSELPKWKGKPDFIQWQTSIVRYLQLSMYSTPFNNLHCRLAVAHALDRQTIATKVIPGVEDLLYTVVPPGFLGYYNGKATANKPGGTPWYSVKLAKQELAKCPGGINVEWPYRVTTADGRNVRAAYGSMLQQVGIHVTFKDTTSQEQSIDQADNMQKTGVKIVRAGWQQDYPDPQDYVSLLLRHGNDYAITGWNNATFNKLVDQADVEPNKTKRAQLYVQAQKIAIAQAAWIPMYVDKGYGLVKPYIHGMVGTSAYADFMPSGGNWAKVTVSKH